MKPYIWPVQHILISPLQSIELIIPWLQRIGLRALNTEFFEKGARPPGEDAAGAQGQLAAASAEAWA